MLVSANTVTYFCCHIAGIGASSCRSAKNERPFKITLSKDEKALLERAARGYTSPYFSVVRAKVVLMAAQGLRNDQIAARVSLPRQIVSKWRKRFFEERLAGLDNLPRSGRPPSFSP